jgi:hypothetical protein
MRALGTVTRSVSDAGHYHFITAAMPPDVRKVYDFPAERKKLRATPVCNAKEAGVAQKQPQSRPERQSHSAHQAA